MVKTLIVLVLLVHLYYIMFKYRPKLDVTRNGDWLLWYDKNGERVYKILYRSEG